MRVSQTAVWALRIEGLNMKFMLLLEKEILTKQTVRTRRAKQKIYALSWGIGQIQSFGLRGLNKKHLGLLGRLGDKQQGLGLYGNWLHKSSGWKSIKY